MRNRKVVSPRLEEDAIAIEFYLRNRARPTISLNRYKNIGPTNYFPRRGRHDFHPNWVGGLPAQRHH